MIIILDDAANQDINDTVSMIASRMGMNNVYHIPDRDDLTYDELLWHIPTKDDPEKAIWIGYIPLQDKYDDLYQELKNKNIYLVNDPKQHQKAMEFDLFYPIIREYTPQSVTITNIVSCKTVAKILGFPIFVKGAIKSEKEKGIKACKADNLEELKTLVDPILKQTYRSRNKAVCRKYVPLKYVKKTPGDFPIGREYRYLMYCNKIITSGYYWGVEDELSKLSHSEKQEVDNLAIMISKKLQIPLIAIDIGQLDSGEWIVIEVGDPQCCGVSHSMAFEFWNKIVVYE